MSDDITKHDVFFLHDPGTAGLIPLIRRAGGRVIWRCHAGADSQTVFTARAWAFLEPFVRQANRLVAYRSTFIPRSRRRAGSRSSIRASTVCDPQSGADTGGGVGRSRVGVLDGDPDAAVTYRSASTASSSPPRPLGDPRFPRTRASWSRSAAGTSGRTWRACCGIRRSHAMSDDVHLLLCGAHDSIADAAETRAVLDRCAGPAPFPTASARAST